MKKHLKKLYIFIGILCIGVFALIFYILPLFLVDISHGPQIIARQELNYSNSEEISIESGDELTLKGVLLMSKSTSNPTVIMIHGLRARKDMYYETAKLLAQNHNLNILLIDLRAHGLSEGRFCTFGVKEKQDVKLWVKCIKSKLPKSKIGVWGQSLGGAVAIQAMAIDKSISFGIIESTFSNLSHVGPDYIERMFGIRWQWLNKLLESRIESLADFKVKEASPQKACKSVTQATLMVHGAADDRIKPSYALENFKSLKSLDKTLLMIPNASHQNVWTTGGDKYFETVIAFIKNQ